MLRCAEAEGTELTGGPGWQRRGEGQRAAESGRWLVGSGRQAVRGDLGAGRAGLCGMGRAERGQAGDEAGRAERNRPGWSGPGEPSAGPRLGRAKLGCWELGRKKKGSGPRQGLGRLGLLRKRAGPMREKRATGKGWAGLGLGFGLG